MSPLSTTILSKPTEDGELMSSCLNSISQGDSLLEHGVHASRTLAGCYTSSCFHFQNIKKSVSGPTEAFSVDFFSSFFPFVSVDNSKIQGVRRFSVIWRTQEARENLQATSHFCVFFSHIVEMINHWCVFAKLQPVASLHHHATCLYLKKGLHVSRPLPKEWPVHLNPGSYIVTAASTVEIKHFE